MPYDPPPEFASLSLPQIAQMLAANTLPPVAEWRPERTSDSFMRIDTDGNWFHQGGAITRPAMVRLFATILRREDDGQFALVTPFERQIIQVDDAPFVAVELRCAHSGPQRKMAFRLNTDEMVLAGPQNPIRFEKYQGQLMPYILVRPGLSARIGRSVYYEMADLALAEHDANTGPSGAIPANQDAAIGLWSDGQFTAFPLDDA